MCQVSRTMYHVPCARQNLVHDTWYAFYGIYGAMKSSVVAISTR